MGMERRRRGGSPSKQAIREAQFEKVNPDMSLDNVDISSLDSDGNPSESVKTKKLTRKERRALKKAEAALN